MTYDFAAAFTVYAGTVAAMPNSTVCCPKTYNPGKVLVQTISVTQKTVSWIEPSGVTIPWQGMNMAPSKSFSDAGAISPAELQEFEAAASRPLKERFKYAFIRTYKPVLDDASYRSFESMADYRSWCEKNLPDWLGYGRI